MPLSHLFVPIVPIFSGALLLLGLDLDEAPVPKEIPAEARAPDITCPTRALWPGDAWPDRTRETAEAHPREIAAMDNYLFPPGLDWKDKLRRGVRTDGVLVLHQGSVLYERYDHGYDANTRHIAWSATKSFVNALAGIGAYQGRLGVDDSVCEHLDDVFPSSCDVTLGHALEFSTGFDWRETYEGQSPTASSVLAMLYGEGHGDMASFVANHPLRDPPGETWSYASGDTNLASAMVGAALAPEYGDEFPWPLLFEPLGMSSAVWERDRAGNYVGSSYLFATPRDLARFGYFLLNDGCWAGERLLPEGWVAWSTAISPAFAKRPLGHDGGPVQGRAFWLNRRVPEIGQDELPWPSAPEGSFAALGHWRQAIYVVPEADLVVVRVGDDRGEGYAHDEMLRLALELVGHPTPPRVGPRAAPQTPEASSSVGPPRYDNRLLDLAAGFAAQEACSCLFVMGRDEAFCREWTRVSPEVARFRVDTANRTVRARALLLGRATARYTGERTGCLLLDRGE